MENLPIIGITQGDINGVGYEVIIKTLNDSRLFEFFTPVVYGQSKIFSYYKKRLGLENMEYTLVRDIHNIQPQRINIINYVDGEVRPNPGISTEVAGEASASALRMAVKDLTEGRINALVAAPINKKNIQSEIFKFHGHTDFISSFYEDHDSLMLMVHDKLRIGTVTNHLALRDVPSNITKELIMKKLRIFNDTLIRDFGVLNPKIAVLSLNPHIGDDGVMGNEDQEIVIPAIKETFENNILAFGPYSADGFFGCATWTKFDGVLAMYHDQGMVPFRALANDGGVKFTAGLPVVRTSPAHGTAYDIVGKNIADPTSFRQAIFTALDIIKQREENNL